MDKTAEDDIITELKVQAEKTVLEFVTHLCHNLLCNKKILLLLFLCLNVSGFLKYVNIQSLEHVILVLKYRHTLKCRNNMAGQCINKHTHTYTHLRGELIDFSVSIHLSFCFLATGAREDMDAVDVGRLHFQLIKRYD